MSRFQRFTNAVFRSALAWGVALAVVVYRALAMQVGPLAGAQEYLTGHWTNYLETLLGCMAVAALAIKLGDAIAECRLLHTANLPAPHANGDAIELCAGHLNQLAQLPAPQSSSLVVTRLRDAIESVQRAGGADGLGAELRALADRDRRRLARGYLLVAAIISIMPFVGLGGTLSRAELSIGPPAFASAGLWNPAIVAAYWSAALVATAGVVVWIEMQVLTAVDLRVASELGGRYRRQGASSDPQVLAVRRMADAVVQATDRLMHRQVELWQSTIQAAHAHWQQASTDGLAPALHPASPAESAATAVSDPSNDDASTDSNQPRILSFTRAESKAA